MFQAHIMQEQKVFGFHQPITWAYVVVSSCLVGLLIACTPSTYAQATKEEQKMARIVHSQANAYRKSIGLNTLEAKSELNRIAYQHAHNMARRQVAFSHDGFDQRVKAVHRSMNKPYTVAENLYYGNYAPRQIPKKAIEGWIKSKGHKVNLTGRYQYTGIGVAKSQDDNYYVVQLYVGR